MNINIDNLNNQKTAIDVLSDPEHQAAIEDEILRLMTGYDVDGSVGLKYKAEAEVDSYGDILIIISLNENVADQYYNIVRNDKSTVSTLVITCIIANVIRIDGVKTFLSFYAKCDLPKEDFETLEMLGKIVTTTADPVTSQFVYCEIPY